MTHDNSDGPSTYLYALPEGCKFKASTTAKDHIRRLNDILHLSMERGDFPKARRAWAILIQCKEYDSKFAWRTALWLAMDNPAQFERSGEGGIDYLKRFMRFNPEQRESVLHELILLLANQGRHKEALDEVQLYLPSFPYQDNPLFHLFAGLICLQISSERESTESPESLLQQARSHLDRSRSMRDDILTSACLREVNSQITALRIPLKDTLDQQILSDDEMVLDSESRPRGKRIRR